MLRYFPFLQAHDLKQKARYHTSFFAEALSVLNIQLSGSPTGIYDWRSRAA